MSLENQLWAEVNRIEREHEQAVAQAKKVYAQVFARRLTPEPGDGAALLAAARIIWPASHLPEAERLNHRVHTIRKDIEQANEFDRKDLSVAELVCRADSLQKTADELKGAMEAIVVSLGDERAAGRRREAARKYFESQQVADEARKRSDKEAEALRVAKVPHRRLFGLVW